MRFAILFPALFAMLLAGCARRPHPVAQIAGDIRDAIPAGWNVTTSNATVRFRSEREMTLIGRISRPAMMSGGIEALAREIGQTTKYEVKLSFAPLLSRVELEKLRAARRPFERVLDTGANSKMDYTVAQIGYEQNRVPSFYTDDYSVFVERPIDRFVEVYPSEAAAQVERLMTSLKGLFHEY